MNIINRYLICLYSNDDCNIYIYKTATNHNINSRILLLLSYNTQTDQIIYTLNRLNNQSEYDSEWSSSASLILATKWLCECCCCCCCECWSSWWRQLTSLSWFCWFSRWVFRHLIRRFWNQTFTCDSDKRKLAANWSRSGTTFNKILLSLVLG